MTASSENTAEEILRRNGRSFNFARVFLKRAHGQRAARLYAFCRYIDDIADEASDACMVSITGQMQHRVIPIRADEPQVVLGRALNKLVMDPLEAAGIRWPWLVP